MIVVLTTHAIRRYQERVKPALTRAQAADELERLLPLATVDDEPPHWLTEDNLHEDAPGHHVTAWAHLSDGVVLPLEHDIAGDLLAVTVLTNGGLSPASRARRNARNHRRRSRRAMRRDKSRDQKGVARTRHFRREYGPEVA